MPFARDKTAKRVHIAAAFDLTPETVWRWRQDYTRDGNSGLASAKPGPKRACKPTDEVSARIVALGAEGHTRAHIAQTAGVSSFSVCQVRREHAAATARPAQATPVFTQGRQLPLTGLLLALVLLALLRESRAEGATREVSTDLGRLLALDRAPEVSTIRRRLAEFSDRGQAGELMAGLAHHQVKGHQGMVGFVDFDGHVRA